jgi:hypothetical protein
MQRYCRLNVLLVPLLLSALAFGQADQPTTAQQPTTQSPTGQPSATPPPAQQTPAAPRSPLDNAAHASKQMLQSAPPAKVYRDNDLRDPEESDDTAPVGNGQPATPTIRHATPQPAAQTADPFVQKAKAFEAQGKIYQNQIRVEKGKIVGIQNHITNLKRQFARWSSGFSQNDGAQVCWTSLYGSYKDYCDTGRNLKAQYDASLAQLAQEKTRLDQMQENIRHKGYGNAIYDPD